MHYTKVVKCTLCVKSTPAANTSSKISELTDYISSKKKLGIWACKACPIATTNSCLRLVGAHSVPKQSAELPSSSRHVQNYTGRFI